jgi:hypothetical protein
LALRRFGPWLLGLFVLAQAAGVLPLMFDHTFHVYEGQRTESHDHSGSGRHGDHRHGTADVKDECCWIKDLTGIAALQVGIARIGFAAARTHSEPTKILLSSPPAGADPLRMKPLTKARSLTKTRFRISNAADRLDRPPKSLSLI